MKKKKHAFTLAEILIALAVIGIAAAMAVPVLMQNINDNQYKSAWKNTWAGLNQAALSIMIDNNGNMANAMGTDSNTMRDAYGTKMNFVKTCNSGDANAGKCWASSWSYYDGSSPVSSLTQASAILSNGSFIYFVFNTAACTTSITNWGNVQCGAVVVDINGNQGPNKWGRDIFAANILSDGLHPYGSANSTGVVDDNNYSGCPGSVNPGYGCSTTYLSGS